MKGTDAYQLFRDFYPDTDFTVTYFEPCIIINASLQSRMTHKRGMSSVNLLSNIAVSGFLLLMSACKVQLQQMDSSQSVTAMVGEDVVLPCLLEPPKDASQMTVEWGRLDLEPRFVFVSLDGQAYPADQNEAYKGRSSMFPDKLKNGDISLKLSDVRHSDNGRFRCYIPNEEKEYFVDLVVGK
ncbi:hypothetical protein GOODEAATRI_021986 [Goodea atripinnis]|uniref:Ig-like domain-containing protein n=1 Tax=Goodea atripinnis TaxID=208336 RepID=A0ABV0N3E3_9TELE